MLKDQYEEHEIWEKVKTFKELLENESLIENINLDDLNFLTSSIDFIESRLMICVVVIVNENDLINCATDIAAAITQLNNFIGNLNMGHVTNAKNNMMTAMNKIRNLPLPIKKSTFNFSYLINNFENNLNKKYEIIEKQNNEFNSDLENHNDELLNMKNETERLKSELVKAKEQIEVLNSNFKEQIASTRENQSELFETDREKYENLFEKEIEQFKMENNKFIDERAELIKKMIDEIDVKKEEAYKIVNLIGDAAVTGNYQKIANENKRSANWLRAISLGIMIVLSSLLIYSIWDISSEDFNWTRSIIRIISAAVLTYPATYAAKESSRHRKLEIRNRRIELELTSINPFIEYLEDVKKKEIKEKLVEKYFGNNLNEIEKIDNKEDDVSVGIFERIIKAIEPIIGRNI